MKPLSQSTIAHLREIADAPDFSGTRYSIIREIARGGMGVIYEAEDRELQRAVALKVLANEVSDANAAARMRAEAQTIARLEHPGIVPVHDAGELPDGRVYYAMKLVRGTRLDEYARSNRGRTDLLRLFIRLCEAVAFAHAHGVIHRDLKPENVMIGSFGEVLVMDWGVARSSTDASEPGLIIGTRGFMAPEQERGEAAIDARADVFALGRTLELLVDKTDRRITAIIRKATNADREQRYRHAGELRDDVTRYLDGQPVSAHRENVVEKIVRWLLRNQALVTIVLAYIVMRVIVFLWVNR